MVQIGLPVQIFDGRLGELVHVGQENLGVLLQLFDHHHLTFGWRCLAATRKMVDMNVPHGRYVFGPRWLKNTGRHVSNNVLIF